MHSLYLRTNGCMLTLTVLRSSSSQKRVPIPILQTGNSFWPVLSPKPYLDEVQKSSDQHCANNNRFLTIMGHCFSPFSGPVYCRGNLNNHIGIVLLSVALRCLSSSLWNPHRQKQTFRQNHGHRPRTGNLRVKSLKVWLASIFRHVALYTIRCMVNIAAGRQNT